MGINPLECEVSVSIAVWPWGAYLGEAAKREGVRAKVSSWRRIDGGSLIPHAKAGGQYLNSVLAKIESLKAGYQEAILLDSRGFVCEGTGENIYVVREGEIITPPQTAAILDGISRRSIITIARDLGYTVTERDLARAELTLADEVFLSGTAAELVAVAEIDDQTIGAGGTGGRMGPITSEIQRVYEDALHGRDERYLEWLDIVPAPTQAPASAG
jgi:branched-chain amino acid aminotransferase